jgi:hypothetical protein
MAGGKVDFLTELSGDLVIHLRTAPAYTIGGFTIPAMSVMIGSGTDARIFAEQAKLGSQMPQIVFTQSSGHTPKILSGPDGCQDIGLHIYAYAAAQPTSRHLAWSILQRCIGSVNAQWGDGTIVHVCNGGLVDTGTHSAGDQSNLKAYWTRLVFNLVIS